MKMELESQIQNLASLTQQHYDRIESIGVLGGQSGVALFQFYCSKYFDNDAYSDVGVEIISSCVDKINNGYSYPTYCNGIAGFGWVLQHLTNNDFIELDLDELLCPFDEFLDSQMQLDISNGEYDFLHGAMGYGFYFLKRYLSVGGKETKNNYLMILEGLVDGLEELAIHEGGMVKWESVLDIEKANKGFNLSLSHGISSIIYLLSRLYLAGIKKDVIPKLIRGAVNYLLSFEDFVKKDISLFPSWVEPKHSLQYKSRLAWCYGDIGIGLALDWGGKVLENNDLNQKAHRILVDTSKRRSGNDTSVVDAGYCHGSFGNAHIFHQLGQQYGNGLYSEAAKFWLDDGMLRYTGSYKEPFRVWDGRDKSWRFELNLLEGISGIGLALVDYLSQTKNTWDECLMLR